MKLSLLYFTLLWQEIFDQTPEVTLARLDNLVLAISAVKIDTSILAFVVL